MSNIGNDVFVCVFLYENADAIVTEIIKMINADAKGVIHSIKVTDSHKEQVAKTKKDCRYPCFIIKKPDKSPEFMDASIDKARGVVASVSKMLK